MFAWIAGRAGLLIALLLGGVALCLAPVPWLAAHGVSALMLAMLLGMALAGVRRPGWQPGLNLAKGPLLRLGVALFGLRLTLADIAGLGVRVWVIDAAVLVSTFALAQWLGRRLRLDAPTRTLIGAGSAICGAAAVLATQPVVRADAQRAGVAVAGVTLFGAAAMVLYPWLYHWLAPLGLSERAYGVLAGSTLHEVAHVVAAGQAVGAEAAASAVVAKMLRVLLLAPFLLWLAHAWRRSGQLSADGAPTPRPPRPWFVLGFVAAAALAGSGWLPEALRQLLWQADAWLLAAAMAALGLDIRPAMLRAAGWRPLALAGALWLWLMLGGGGINWLLSR